MALINIDSPEANGALSVCKVISGRGNQAFLVGGAVRDALMGREAHDFDVATSATPDQILRWFPKVIPTGIKHGTVTVMDDLGNKFEVTTFRGDGVYTDGRRPDRVYFSDNIEHDLARRDFTMNAIAFDPVNDRFCDPFGGAADICLKRIKAVGDPLARFREDGLRALRACRFHATLEFDIEARTIAAIPRTLDIYTLVSQERIAAEWFKIFENARLPSFAFQCMADTGLLWVTVPELEASVGCAQNKYHGFDVWNHTISVMDNCPSDPIVLLAALFHDVSKPECKGRHPQTGEATFYNHEERGAVVTREIMERMKFSNDQIDRVTHLIRHHLLPREALSAAGVRRWVRRVGPECIPQLMALAKADVLGKGPAQVKLDPADVDRFWDRVKDVNIDSPIVTKTSQLAVTGKDVMITLGIKPGPEIGLTLTRLLDYVTDNPDQNTRDGLIAKLEHWK